MLAAFPRWIAILIRCVRNDFDLISPLLSQIRLLRSSPKDPKVLKANGTKRYWFRAPWYILPKLLLLGLESSGTGRT
jgi:hypothetical protein